MKKSKLANQLRKIQMELAIIKPEVINILTDNEIIDCYNSCSCCGEKLVSESELNEIIKISNTADEFFDEVRIAQMVNSSNEIMDMMTEKIYEYLYANSYPSDTPSQLLQKALTEVTTEIAIDSIELNHDN